MRDIRAREFAQQRLDTMITSAKVKKWRRKIAGLVNPVFDGSLNVNILPVSDDPHGEIINGICRQASGVASGLYLEDLIPLCNPQFKRSRTGSGHDIHSQNTAVDVKMSTETVKKGDKKKVSKTLVEKSKNFTDCYWVEFFGKTKTEEIEGVMWYSGDAGHKMLGLNADDVEWIAKKVYEFRQKSFQAIKSALE